mgnify:CR=1 FL=1
MAKCSYLKVTHRVQRRDSLNDGYFRLGFGPTPVQRRSASYGLPALSSPHLFNRPGNLFSVQSDVGQAYFQVVGGRVNLFFNLRFGDVVGREAQGLSCQSSGPRGVAVGDGGGVELGAFGGGGAQ